jgi:hypothetical protein
MVETFDFAIAGGIFRLVVSVYETAKAEQEELLAVYLQDDSRTPRLPQKFCSSKEVRTTRTPICVLQLADGHSQ